MPLPQVLLSIENITARTQSENILEQLSLAIKQGEQWAVIGRSGSGKTALLQAIYGKITLSKGSITRNFYHSYLQDNKVDDPFFSYQRLIGYVPIRPSFTSLTGLHDLYYQQRYNVADASEVSLVSQLLKAIDPPPSQKHLPQWAYEEVLELLFLRDLEHSHLIKLSNGEIKRLIIAAALLKNPRILLMDHPLTGLDVQTRKKFDQIIEVIIQKGTTLIITTSPTEIPSGISHIAVLDKGKIAFEGEKDAFDPLSLAISQTPVLDKEKLRVLLPPKQSHRYETIVIMKNVTVRYGDKVILNRINWEIKPGEHWALSGANGSGKSTLLSLIYGDNPQAYSSDISLFDRKRGTGESIWDIKRNIGFISPELHQYFPGDQTCLKVIESGFYDTTGLYRKSTEAKKVTSLEWMKFFALEENAEKLFRDISFSSQRLCLLARALVKNPALLLLDEPCQGLDVDQQKYFRSIVDSICELSNTTIIYVTHHQEELPDCIQKEMVLK